MAEVITGFRYSSGNVAGWQQDLQVASAAEYPAKDFWSIVVYDNQTRSKLQTDQRLPAVGSQKGAVANPDTSVDVYFGPTAPAGHEANWVQDHSRQRLERPPSPLRPAPAVVRQDVAAR